MEKVSFDIILNLKDRISGALDKVGKAFTEVEKDARAAAGQSERFGNICSKLSIPNANAIISVVERVTDGLAGAAAQGMSFGQSMADLSSITGIAGKELEQLEADARKFGQDSGLGAGTAARAYSILASQIQVAEIGMEGLNTLQEKSITLAHASGMSLDASAEALAGTINQFGLGADQAERVINVLAAGSKYGAAEISELSQSFKVVGASASAMGLNVESTAGALEVLSKANLKGSEAGTALRNIILKLNTELGIDLGETSLGTALDALKPKLTDATFLSKVFGMENLAAAQFLIQNAESVDTMTATLTGTSVAQEQAATRTQTTAQRMAELRARMDDIKISITNVTGSLTPYITLLAENAAAIGSLTTMSSSLFTWLGKANQVIGVLTGSTLTHTVAVKAATSASAAWKVVQIALNAVLTMNPLGIVITAVAALSAAVVYCYNHFEGFRKVVDVAWSAVKRMASAVWDHLVKAFEKASAVIREAWTWVKNFFGIEDGADVDKATDALDNQTQAVERNTEAKKKALSIDFSKVGTGSEKKTATKKTGKKGSIAYLDDRINKKQEELELAISPESRRSVQMELDELQKQKRTIELELEYGKPVEDARQLKDMAGIKSGFARSKNGTSAISPKELKVGHKYVNTYEEALKQAQKTQDNFVQGAGAVSDAFGSIGQAVGGAAGQWLVYGANLVGTVAQSVPAIMQMIAAMTAETAASQTKTTANVAEASSEAMKAHAGIPFVGVAMGVAAIAAIVAAMMSLPKFETGGVVGGTSYYGDRILARVNSGEMILNRQQQSTLYGLVNNAGGNGTGGGKVVFKIKGRTLEGILEREARLSGRS